jgi:hypothetical protein
MKGKIFVAAVLLMVGLTLLVNGRQAQARVTHAMPLDHVYTALNSGDADTAAASFTEDATAENLVRKQTYNGVNEIRQMLQGMQREGRRFDIVDVRMIGDNITAKVEVSDRGKVWGTETIEAVVDGTRLQNYTLKSFRLELWRINR